MEEKQSFLSRVAGWRPIKAVLESIRNKLLVSLLALALIPLIILGFVAFFSASNALNTKSFDQLTALRTNKAAVIKDYFTARKSDMDVLAETVNALRQDAFQKLEAVQTLKANEIKTFIDGAIGDIRFARNLVVVRGSEGVVEGLPTFTKFKNDKNNPDYKAAFDRSAGVLTPYIEENGYLDAMMLDTTGEIVFALDGISLGLDESKSISFQKGLDGVYVSDIIKVAGHEELLMRVAAPVKDRRNRTIGVIFLEIDLQKINNIMTERSGLGKTGETYLVGPDKLFRSDSRFVTESTILNKNFVVDTVGVNDALAGNSGQDVFDDYRGSPVLSAYSPLVIGDFTWAIMAEIDVEEAFAPHIVGQEKDYYTQYKEAYGYYDLFLFNPDGYLFYTVVHEPDYQTNLLTGPYKDTNLGRLIAEVSKTKQYGLADFEKYAPSQDAPAAFIAQPIIHDGGIELIVALQLPIDQINAVMQERAGLGETGETYLVGQDKLWRSDSAFLANLGAESTVLNEKFTVNTVASQTALVNKKDGTQIINDYRGISVLSSWAPITLIEPSETNPDGIVWAMISEIDREEVQRPVTSLAQITTGLVVGSAILVVLVAFLLSGSLVRQVDAITDLFSGIGIGDFESRAEITTQDELGVMANSLNSMLDNTLSLIQSQDERDVMQNSIMGLLEEVSGIADGDLTVEAVVTADMTGAIADAFNFMVIQLRDVISNVQNATLQVSSSANEIQATAEHLASGSESQSAQIIDTSAAIDEMAVSIQQVSENAALSATVGEQATANAQDGAKVVQDTIDGMNRIRDQVQETAKRIKRLGESSQEIGEIVQLISDIADRTSILALNASIQAAMAGEAGRGFAVVAEEVERLADRSTSATKQIDSLIKTIQSETNEAVAAMEATTNEVVTGSQLANQAGQALSEIEAVSQRLSELIQSISMASKQQARGSEALAKSMGDISGITQQTAAGTKQAAVSISNLAELADELRESVSTFKLPDSNGSS